MPNRVIQAKIVKMKKARQKLPYRFRADYVHVNVPREPAFFGKANHVTLFLRGTTNHQEAEFMARQHQIAAMFPTFFGFKDNEPRKAVKERVYELLKDVPADRNVVVFRGKHGSMRLFFNVTHDCFRFVKCDLFQQCMWVSINYGSRSSAMSALKNQRIQWKKPLRISDFEGQDLSSG